jgi:PAS domain S-box-containing protein
MSDVLGEFARTIVTDFPVGATLQRLAERAVDVLPVSSAEVVLDRPGGRSRCAATSDPLGARSDRPPSGDPAPRSFPLRWGADVVGSLQLHGGAHGAWDEAASEAAQTFADVASAYLFTARARVDSEAASERARRSSAHDDESVLALRTSEQRKAAILASVLDAVITIDADGGVLEFNPAAERIFGHLEDDATDRNLVELLAPPEAMGDRWMGVGRYLASDEGPLAGRRIELTGTRGDGTTFPAEVSITAVDGPGPPLFTAFVRDLTRRVEADAERRDLEARVQQSERLASMGQLAGGVAHDFNNLLTVILNYSSFIVESEETDEATRSQAGEIMASAERAAALTKQLLLFARREPVRRAPLDIGEVVRAVRSLLVQAVGEAVELVIVESGELPLVIGDRGQFEQMLMNLAVNARDAMPEGGLLTVATSLVHGDGAPWVELRVTDVGEGMDADVAAHAFDPFFTTKPLGHGSGLGLATVYGVVSDAGGTIGLTSAPGAGSTFAIRLPVPAEVVGAPEAPAISSPAIGNGETVLVVEDQVPVRKVIVAMLRRNGYQVVEAADAPTALDLASAEEYDLLLTDIVMPGLSGRDLVAELRRQRPLQRVLYMSGYSGGAFGTQRALDHGEALIHKPFKEGELLTAVHGALRQTAGRQPGRLDAGAEPAGAVRP